MSSSAATISQVRAARERLQHQQDWNDSQIRLIFHLERLISNRMPQVNFVF